MNRVLDSEVRHPSELFKGRQILKLGFNKICHFNSTDVSDLSLPKGALISGLLFNSAKVSFKSDQCGACCGTDGDAGCGVRGGTCGSCEGSMALDDLLCFRYSNFVCLGANGSLEDIGGQNQRWVQNSCKISSYVALGLFVEHLACDKNRGSFRQNKVYPNTQ